MASGSSWAWTAGVAGAAAAAGAAAGFVLSRASASAGADDEDDAGARGASGMPWDKHGIDRTIELGPYEERPEFAVTSVRVLRTPHLRETFPELDAGIPNDSPRLSHLLKADYAILGDIVRKVGHAPVTRAYVRAGPRPKLFFNPGAVRAGIMTVGGLCPGLNNVVREITRTLINVYNVDSVLGLRDGLWGLHDGKSDEELMLTVESVRRIHLAGGSVLGSARGGLTPELLPAAVEGVRRRRLSMLFIIGGDGTHAAAGVLSKALREAKVPCSVVCVPKTIDNDIDIIDRSFGFTTSVAESLTAITAAKVEAEGAPGGVGIVKLMGRNAGFIAAHSVLACGVVDACLIPEVPVEMTGPRGLLPHIARTVRRKGHAVIVVAEGAGQDIADSDPAVFRDAGAREAAGEGPESVAAAVAEAVSRGRSASLAGSGEKDAGGHAPLRPVAKFLKSCVTSYFKGRGEECNVKLIDPSYIIRSVPASANDALYCLLLGQNAAHAAMAGFTEISLGLCNNRMVLLPITAIVENSPRVMDPMGRTWERVVSCTGQPNTARRLTVGGAGAVTGRTIF